MLDSNEVIERRELEVRCWHCAWKDFRTLSWLSSQRDMNCPCCSSVIVLNSSDLTREIARQRRQLTALQGQMSRLLTGATTNARRIQPVSRSRSLAPALDLALAKSHPDTMASYCRPASNLRRLRG